ncbi:MAG: hypothetical protein ACRD8W_28160 [Nitrososphaeraceae archaeon]
MNIGVMIGSTSEIPSFSNPTVMILRALLLLFETVTVTLLHAVKFTFSPSSTIISPRIKGNYHPLT